MISLLVFMVIPLGMMTKRFLAGTGSRLLKTTQTVIP
jgi:hypothetical protein